MEFEVIEDHISNNSKPLKIIKGEKVKVGKISDESDGWVDWIYCYRIDGSSKGWVPIQIIQISYEYGIVLQDYSAEELEIKKGESVEIGIELNGWMWCKDRNRKKQGWLPKKKLKMI
jgi:hypothetical protein